MTEAFATSARVRVWTQLLRYLERPHAGDLLLAGLVGCGVIALLAVVADGALHRLDRRHS